MTGFRLGLTGSIGMGKSTTSAMFAAEGVPVWDADQAVHRLYAQGGAAVGPLSALFPEAEIEGAIRRDVLRRRIAEDAGALAKIESVVHPLVVADRTGFIAQTPADLLLLDIPLLFETGADSGMDASLVVTARSATYAQNTSFVPAENGTSASAFVDCSTVVRASVPAPVVPIPISHSTGPAIT
jgi:dephospho-CoA kinase